ncbi:hypothetical protein KP509_27G002700 [Ceratopteris richardii]|uniref:acetylglutamate kinase n=1 Tax=Ceratopteris richardii TaxID=49495 RepID=A0A8T2RDE9_CERRI|nr:hypothetical protein KP509_27G002700 [Ceratopteris richardii]
MKTIPKARQIWVPKTCFLAQITSPPITRSNQHSRVLLASIQRQTSTLHTTTFSVTPRNVWKWVPKRSQTQHTPLRKPSHIIANKGDDSNIKVWRPVSPQNGIEHGGGLEINQWLGKLGILPKFEGGLRVTDEATMEIVEMVLVGKVNKSLVSLINKAGGIGVGLCGKDARMITARPTRGGSLGLVGEVSSIDTSILRNIIKSGAISVIASVAADHEGKAYNINADTAAGEIAASLGAEKLILLTDVPGIMMDMSDPNSLVREISIQGIRKLVDEGKVSGGMIPKVECCIRSLAQGVRTASIIDGRLSHSSLLEILTNEGASRAMIVR